MKSPILNSKKASELIENATPCQRRRRRADCLRVWAESPAARPASAAPFKPGLTSDGPSPPEPRARPVPEPAAAVSKGPALAGRAWALLTEPGGSVRSHDRAWRSAAG